MSTQREKRPRKPRGVYHLEMRAYHRRWRELCLDRQLMRAAMIGAMRITRYYNDESLGTYWYARRQLYAWARVHAAEYDIPLIGALYATLTVAACWQDAMTTRCEHGEYLTTKWSATLTSPK